MTGGQVHNTGPILDNVEMYNISTNTWSQVPSMHYEKMKHGSCSLANNLYVLGGQDVNKDNLEVIESFPAQ